MQRHGWKFASFRGWMITKYVFHILAYFFVLKNRSISLSFISKKYAEPSSASPKVWSLDILKKHMMHVEMYSSGFVTWHKYISLTEVISTLIAPSLTSFKSFTNLHEIMRFLFSSCWVFTLFNSQILRLSLLSNCFGFNLRLCLILWVQSYRWSIKLSTRFPSWKIVLLS